MLPVSYVDAYASAASNDNPDRPEIWTTANVLRPIVNISYPMNRCELLNCHRKATRQFVSRAAAELLHTFGEILREASVALTRASPAGRTTASLLCTAHALHVR